MIAGPAVRTVPTDLSQIVHPASTALILWDLQEGIARRAHNLPLLIRAVTATLTAARTVGVPVIWSRHVLPPIQSLPTVAVRNLMRRQKVASPDALRPSMQAGSSEVRFLPDICPAGDDIVIEKETPSFFVGTPLELRLRARGVRTLVLCGVATDLGIELTARHATALGFFVVVPGDGVGAFGLAEHDSALDRLRQIADVVNSTEVVSAWEGDHG